MKDKVTEEKRMNEILIVDDAMFMRRIIKNALSDGGFSQFIEAKDGSEAIHLFKKHKPKLVLLDITMPAVQYAVINSIYSCPKTILGDFGQCVNPNYQNTLDDMRRLYSGAEFIALNKSYRSTYEIIQFAAGGRNPVRIVCDTKLRIPLTAQLVKTAQKTRTIIVTGSSDVKKRSLLSKAGCEIFTLPLKNGRIDLKTLMRKLGEMDIDSVLMEGRRNPAFSWYGRI